MASAARIGERRSYDGALCTVRYIGEVAGTTGSWLGVEWDDPSRGKHDGQHKGVRYFSCKSKSATAASFVRPTRPADARQDFLSALHLKYATDPTAEQNPPKQIVFSGKVAEEVGFEKVRRKQAQLDELRFVILDGAQVAYAYASQSAAAGDGAKDGRQSIGQVCPKVRELDLSRNLFERFGPVVEICSELRQLRDLRVNGNRFQHVLEDERLASADGVFDGVTELALEDTLLEWQEVCHIAAKFPSLTTLYAGSNQLSALTPISAASFTSTLVSLHLEFNDFSSLADIAPLSAIPSLRNLTLKLNRISHITAPSSSPTTTIIPPPTFSPNLHYLDLSYNNVTTWSFIDALPASFPGLTSLRFTHNPIYDDPDLDNPASSSLPAQGQGQTQKRGISKTDESYMLVVARMGPSLKTLNFSTITPADRADADMFYLSRIARQLAAVPEGPAEQEVLARHRRWKELCELYGEPVVVRQKSVDGNFLEARLITAEFTYYHDGEWVGGKTGEGGGGGEDGDREGKKKKVVKTVQIPKLFDIYAVKGIVGRMFGLSPLRLRLVWETGEWDPVGGFDEVDEESEEEAEDLAEAEWERREEAGGSLSLEASKLPKKGGRWVKREVELKDGPRQFGYCVDGLEAKIRVERR
ncbi:hypothetical protein C8A03DRAFT_33982 [Achaetomium macrosporum]|uniref:CAP-Gly domain-containing protein n=1 Tax=Achaetomium macrosporum TaxID=79813 RepID=A0AAN7HDV5_9PEZI|nr:hypothetical protein C8A03DRAFT_33982 [Achaetomium macrosporum]